MEEDLKKEQKEIVRQRQIEIAKSMKVQPEILEILERVEEWQDREWLYICALDGMPAEQIHALEKGKASTSRIRKARMEYLRAVCEQTDPFRKKIASLQKEVQDVCRESREARNAIEAGLESALKKQAQAQEETIRTKDRIIEMLTSQTEELQRQLQEYQNSDKGKKGRKEGKSVRQEPQKIFSVTDRENAWFEEGEGGYMADRTAVGMPPREQRNLVQLKPGKEEMPEGNDRPETGKFFQWISSVRKDSDIRRFIAQYIKNDDMTSEQKTFLLDCLEEGMSVKEVEKFASPGLAVDVMQRLKKLQSKR